MVFNIILSGSFPIHSSNQFINSQTELSVTSFEKLVLVPTSASAPASAVTLLWLALEAVLRQDVFLPLTERQQGS